MKHALFDLDHTLWDFDGNSNLTMLELFTHFHLDQHFPSYNDFHNEYLKNNAQLWRDYAAGQTDKEHVRIDRFHLTLLAAGINNRCLADEIAQFYLDNNSVRPGVMPHAHEVLQALRQHGYTISIVTNGFKEVQYKKLDHSKLAPLVDNLFISDNIGFMKPDPRFFQHVLTSLNTAPANCILIGDNPDSDIQGALNVAIKAIFYNSRSLPIPQFTTPLLPNYQVPIITSLNQLLPLL